ncbi:MAG: energy-coupling factor transporter transmembrane protein EcfT, partial [Natronomonas sp.]
SDALTVRDFDRDATRTSMIELRYSRADYLLFSLAAVLFVVFLAVLALGP